MDRTIIVSYKGLKRQRFKGPKDKAADAKNFETLWLCGFVALNLSFTILKKKNI
jgi:hypothetical protein